MSYSVITLAVMMSLWNGNISALLAFCEGNPPVTGGFRSQRPVTQSFDVFVDLRQNKRLSKQSRRLWFEMSSNSLWRHCNGGSTYQQGGGFNLKVTSYQFRNYHYGDNMISLPSYLIMWFSIQIWRLTSIEYPIAELSRSYEYVPGFKVRTLSYFVVVWYRLI